MHYYEVYVADNRYRRDTPLTYFFDEKLRPGQIVTVPLKNKVATGFVLRQVKKPQFPTKSIKTTFSSHCLPAHCLQLAYWLKNYYHTSLGEALRQFAPSAPILRPSGIDDIQLLDGAAELELNFEQPLTNDQKKAILNISKSSSSTILLHGETGTGKTRVYLELAKNTLKHKRSVIMLTPEIALTSQLAHVFSSQLTSPVYVLHSQLPAATRKKIWRSILESIEPIVVIGPRSALFSPVAKPGLIVLDEAHEPSYKQDKSPRYHAERVASELGIITNSKVVLGTATPSVSTYYLADARGAIVKMTKPAVKSRHSKPKVEIVDIKDRTNFKKDSHLSDQLIDAIRTTLLAKKQVMIYLNRRGSSRLILCNLCGWQLLCPNCDVSLVYHADSHIARCHICSYHTKPPLVCPKCGNLDIVYKGIGTKALAESVNKLFPEFRVQRFDSDNISGERVHELYYKLRKGEIDILVGTQILAKGFDLPKLGLVGIVTAETSLALPDYTAEERSFQLIYQVVGRVGRGHVPGKVVVQSYDPGNVIIDAALSRNYQKFYNHTLKQRKKYRFPPFCFMMRLICRRATYNGAQRAAFLLAKKLTDLGLPVELVGPAPAFYARRGRFYYWQIVVKSKSRSHLLKLADYVPANWMIDLDPINLL